MPEECRNCGANDFGLLDGYYFCNLCGSQCMNLRETEEEFTHLTQQSSKGVQKVVGKRSDLQKREALSQQKTEIKESDANVEFFDRARRKVDFPDFLRTIGHRLCTFTKLVSKISNILANEYGVPGCCVEYSLWILQTYFKRFGAAFHEKETGNSDEDLFTPWSIKTADEIVKLKKEAIAAREKAVKSKRAERLSQLSFWEQIATQEDDELHEDGEEQDLIHITSLAKVETKLTEDTVKSAALIYVEIDMVLSVVFVSVLLSGCKWIQLSDLYRWYREGRFGITKTQLNALSFSNVWDKANQTKKIARRNWRLHEAIQSASENMRVLAFLTQFTGIPKQLCTLDFPLVISRLVYNLNLPRVFIYHLNMVLSCLPAANMQCGSSYFASIIPLIDSVTDNVFKRKEVGPMSFFVGLFGENRRHYCQLLSADVKAAGLLLFALKLFFGLDDLREHNLMPVKSHENDDLDAFNFTGWLQQLRLRMHVWQGKSLKVVVNKNFSSDQSATDSGKARQRTKLPGQWRTPGVRDDALTFLKCVPNTLEDRNQPNLFHNMFVDDHSRASDNSEEALFTPLMFHAKNEESFIGEISMCDDIDPENLGAFFKDSTLDHMDFEYGPSIGDSYDNNRRYSLPNLSETVSDHSFHRCFPCSDAYLRFPPHNISCIAYRIFNKNMDKLNVSADAQSIISKYSFIKLLNSAKRWFSKSFSTLIRHLAITVGESEELLFLSFLLCEYMFFEKQSMQKVESVIRNRDIVGLEYNNFCVRLDENVDSESPTYKFTYKLFQNRSRMQISGEALKQFDTGLNKHEKVEVEYGLSNSDSSNELSEGSENTSTDGDMTEDKSYLRTLALPQSKACAVLAFRFW